MDENVSNELNENYSTPTRVWDKSEVDDEYDNFECNTKSVQYSRKLFNFFIYFLLIFNDNENTETQTRISRTNFEL